MKGSPHEATHSTFPHSNPGQSNWTVGPTMSNHGSHSDSLPAGDTGDPGPYWKRVHRDWRFWVGAVFMAAALAIYVLSGDLAWVSNGHRQPAVPASAAN